MNRLPTLHVLFTMDCHPAGTRTAPEGPRTWEQSIRSIDGFCIRLLNAGYAATLFLTPRCAVAHAPLVEELAERSVELGLYIQPGSLEGARHRGYLGQYNEDIQRSIINLAMEGFQDVVGRRPLSARSYMFSASDATFALLTEHGFRQGSMSSPGRRVSRHVANWSDAERDAHFVDASSRLRRGNLPFLEVPVTTDSKRVKGGVSPELCIENGTLVNWHRPLIDGQLARFTAEQVQFKALCFYTRNCFGYDVPGNDLASTLDDIVGYIDSLRDRYDIVPVTVGAAHASYREMSTET